MSILAVRDYFITTLEGAIDASITKVVKEGENFTPKTADFPYIRFQLSPREVSVADGRALGGAVILEAGLARFDLWYARNLNSVDEPLTMAETIKTTFLPQQVVLAGSNQLILEMSWSESVRYFDNAIGIPVLVRWSNYKQ